MDPVLFTTLLTVFMPQLAPFAPFLQRAAPAVVGLLNAWPQIKQNAPEVEDHLKTVAEALVEHFKNP